MATANMELRVDLKAAQDFLDAVSASAKNKFAIARAGDVVFFELDRPVPDTTHNRLESAVRDGLAGTGVYGVLLPHGVKVARLKILGGE